MTPKIQLPYKNIETIQDYDIDIANREIYLTGENTINPELPGIEPGVEYLMANKLIKNVRYLSSINKKPILIHMKTCGGDFIEGMAIYDAILACPCRITILSYTHARSMSSIILQAANRRVLMPDSYVMIHYGTAGYYGLSQEVETNFEWNKKNNDVMLDIYINKMRSKGTFKGETTNKIKNFLKKKIKDKIDVFFTPSEAIDLGLADEIFNGNWSKLK